MSREAGAHDLLPWYYSGTLSTADRSAFETHLSGCSACQKELELLGELRSASRDELDRMLSEHPTPSELVDALLSERSRSENDAVYRHLAFCPTCAVEAGLIRGEHEPDTREAPRAEHGRRPFGSPAWVGWAVAITIAVAALSYAGYVSWTDRMPTPPSMWSGTPKLNVIEAPTRMGKAAHRIALSSEQPYVLLALVAPDEPADDDDLFEVKIFRPEGAEIVWLENFDDVRLREHQEAGVIPLVIPTRTLATGHYEIVFVRIRGSQEELIQRDRFEVVLE